MEKTRSLAGFSHGSKVKLPEGYAVNLQLLEDNLIK